MTSHKISRYDTMRIQHGGSWSCNATYRAGPDPVWKFFHTRSATAR